MSDIPVEAPAECPGTASDSAGRASACDGCPNQSACSSGEAKLSLSEREPEVIATIRRRLEPVRHRILILSGKGGVGKSSLAVCLARAFTHPPHSQSKRRTDYPDGCTVGLLDLDLCGPSIPCMLGCMNAEIHQSQSGWSPVYASPNLALMSAGFLLPSPDHALIWRGPRKNALIRQLLSEVCWTDASAASTPQESSFDFLFIDTPPGTSDEHLSVVQYLQAANCLDGALIVTTPQEVALSDVRKEIDFCHKLSVPILGVVENMSEFQCPACGHRAPVFPPTTGGAASLCAPIKPSGPSLLAQLPMDPRLTRALDEGVCPFELSETNALALESGSGGGDIDDQDHNSLLPTDPIILAYRDLADRLWDQLTLEKHRHVDGNNQPGPIDMETGEICGIVA